MIRSKVFVTLLIVTLGLVFATTAQAERSFSFPELIIDVNVAEDGTFSVVEQRTAKFEGKYTGMWQWINLQGAMEVTDVTVAENGQVYRYNNAHDIGPAGTYYAEKQDDRIYIDWSFTAVDENRTFTISYKVNNALLVHNDVAEFYYQFVGNKWDASAKHALVTVHLPPGATKDQLRAWGHGPLHGDVTIVDGQTVQWEISPLAAKTMLEGRVTFPPELVPQAQTRTGKPGLPDILAEEERWAEEANHRRQLAQIDWKLGIALVLAGVAGAFMFWRKYGKAYPADFAGDYFRELPQSYSPAELGVLWSMGQVRDRDLSATLLDLARRKYVKLEEYQLETKGVLRSKEKTGYRLVQLENGEEVAPHERRLLDFLFTDVAQKGKDEVTLSQLEEYAKKNKKEFAKFWSKWQSDVKKLADKHQFFDKEVTPKGQKIGIALSLVVMVASVPAFIFALPFSGVGLLVAGFILLITAAVVNRRSMSGNNDYVRWKAFQRFLKHFSEISRQEVPALVIWEHFLVYAVTLGVAKEVLKQLAIVFPNLQDGDYRFGYGWYYYGHRSNFGVQGLTNLTSSVQNSFTQSIQAATSQASSGSGAGGGFSRGGGGGFGGGGGGAR